MSPFALMKDIRNPFSKLKYFFKGLKFCYQRARYGFCDKDIWNLNQYLLNMTSLSMNKLAETTHTYDGRYETFEDWQKELHRISKLLYMANEGNDYFETPLADEYYNNLLSGKNFREKYPDACINELKENMKKMGECKNEAMSWLKENLYSLWD